MPAVPLDPSKPLRQARPWPGPAHLAEARRFSHHLSAAQLEALRAIPSRRELVRSSLWREVAPEVTRISYGLEYGGGRVAARVPARGFLRALTWNIERGIRLDGIKAFVAARPELLDADLVLLNEVDVGMARSQNRHVGAEIAELFGFEYVFGNSYLCLSHGDVRDGHPEGVNEVGLHGNAILSRFPIRRAENFTVAITRDKFESSEKRLGHKKALWAEVDSPFGLLAVVSAHLDPYASCRQRGDQMADVMQTVERRGLGPAVLLGGDLNSMTYDLGHGLQLAGNLARKLVRGGVPHVVEHYMTPHLLYERPTFDTLRAHRFDVEPFNDMSAGTTRYEVGTFESESQVRDHMPGLAVDLLRYKLRPWGGVVPLKVDWFAGRGLRTLARGEIVSPNGRSSMGPTVFERASHAGERLSDHDPVLVDVVLA